MMSDFVKVKLSTKSVTLELPTACGVSYYTMTKTEAERLCLDLAGALSYQLVDSSAPEVSTPADPALLLAQRIARIAAETGLKPGMVFRIVNQLNWEAQEAAQAAAPQEDITVE